MEMVSYNRDRIESLFGGKMLRSGDFPINRNLIKYEFRADLEKK